MRYMFQLPSPIRGIRPRVGRGSSQPERGAGGERAGGTQRPPQASKPWAMWVQMSVNKCRGQWNVHVSVDAADPRKKINAGV